MIYLEGNTVILRDLSINDVNEEYLSWLNDKEVMSGLATGGYTIESLKNYVNEKVQNSDCVFLAICDKQSGKHIGNVKFDFFDKKSNVIEFGLLIGDKNFWGKGVGKETSILMIDYGFKVRNYRKVWISIYENNPNSLKIYQKLGFVQEGSQRKHVCVDGIYYDKYLLGIFKEEWENRL